MALIMAIFIVAIVATVAAQLGLGQQVWLRQAQNVGDRGQAEQVMRGAVRWAVLILNDDQKKNPNVTDLSGDWAKDLPPLPAEGGVVVGKIRDAQARFNLNNLVRNGQQSQADKQVFNRLLVSLGLDVALTEAVIDWIDADGNGVAEDLYYMNLVGERLQPYRAANQPFESVEELRLVRGFDREILDRLRPHVVALPMPTDININTAAPELLAALFAQMALAQAKALTDARDKGAPFKDKGELAQRAGQAPAPNAPYDVKSSNFLVGVQARFGRVYRQSEALISRGGSGKLPQMDWISHRL